MSLRGTVIIIANHGDRIDIPAGAVLLENKIVSGNGQSQDSGPLNVKCNCNANVLSIKLFI